MLFCEKCGLTSLTADEGYFSVEQVCGLQSERIRVIIGDPHASKRRPDKQDSTTRQVLAKAKRAVKSASGKALLRKRGEHLERSFCHVLDHGKHRRATLRGRKNLTKRQLCAALAHNLSLLLRHLTGCGTAKQWLAGKRAGRMALHWSLRAGILALVSNMRTLIGPNRPICPSHRLAIWIPAQSLIHPAILRFSTGC